MPELTTVDLPLTATEKDAFEKWEMIKTALKQQQHLTLLIGRMLKIFRDQKLYKLLGTHETFAAFLSDPEIGMRQSTAYHYIQIVELYEQKLGLTEAEIDNVPINRLIRMKSYLATLPEPDAKEKFFDLAPLSTSDFEVALVECGAKQDKPLTVSNDENTAKQVIKFDPERTAKIINSYTGEVVWEAA